VNQVDNFILNDDLIATSLYRGLIPIDIFIVDERIPIFKGWDKRDSEQHLQLICTRLLINLRMQWRGYLILLWQNHLPGSHKMFKYRLITLNHLL